jgi:ribonuclease HII
VNPVSIKLESKLRKSGFMSIAGVDEAGIGPLAGPVVAAAVILSGKKLSGVDDSKKLSAEQRGSLFADIISNASAVGVGIIDSQTIDSINVLQSTGLAMKMAVTSLSIEPDHVLVDGIRKIPGIRPIQTAVKGGDASCYSIAAASIVAKVIRDRIMHFYDKLYPQYGFSSHKGYGTKLHLRSIKKFGICAIHRKSYEPVITELLAKGLIFLDSPETLV